MPVYWLWQTAGVVKKYSQGKSKITIRDKVLKRRFLTNFSSARKEPLTAHLVSRSFLVSCFSTKEHSVGEDTFPAEAFSKSELLAPALQDLSLLLSGHSLVSWSPYALAWRFSQTYHMYYYLRPVPCLFSPPEMFSHI